MKIYIFLIAAAFLSATALAQMDRQPEEEEDIWAENNGEHDDEQHQCYEKLVRKNYTRCSKTWKNLTEVHLEDHHKSFVYNFSFPKSKCCYTIHFYPHDLANQINDRMTCDQKAQTKRGFYQLELSLTANTKHHFCKVIRDEIGRENITCRGKLEFDPSMQTSNIWYAAVSRCGSRDGVDLTHFMNFTSEKDKCDWKDDQVEDWGQNEKEDDGSEKMASTWQNATKEFQEIQKHYPVSAAGMLAVAIITGLNTLLIIIGFVIVLLKFRKMAAQNSRAENYSNAVYEPTKNEKLPL